MNQGNGPDILGVCEIENQNVMQLLVAAMAPLGRNYAVIHHDMSDHRGIDIGFIYDANMYTPDPNNPWFSYEVLKRSATRDIFQINLDTANGNRLILIGNHWPARLGAGRDANPSGSLAVSVIPSTRSAFHSKRYISCPLANSSSAKAYEVPRVLGLTPRSSTV